MSRSMLINVTQEEESRVAIVSDGRLEWIEIETGVRDTLKGNIYRGVVENVNISLQAAFVNFGGNRAGFLPFDEVNFRLLPARKRESGARAAQESGSRRTRISDHLKSGQEVLVQVVREPYASKPPTLSTFFSLPGRYLVLLPASGTGGISRKIDTDAGRERLKKILKQLDLKEGFGLIVRTAGIDQTKTALTRDLRYLMRLWTQIEKAAKKVSAPALIFRERDLVLRAIRDLYTQDISEVLIDSEEVYLRALRYFRSIMPSKQKLVKLYEGDRPLFARYDLEDQIENIYKRRVPLPSGGAIVIDETEALTSIDVNSGKTRESSIEETAHRTNVEAAVEVARQLRLRDIGGLVVIDFIDMRTSSYIRDVEKRLRESMKQDKARHDMTRISKLGLLEMSRQRLRPTTMSSSYNTCVECEGNGVVKTVESAALSVLRKIQTRSAQGDWARIRVTLPLPVAEYLQNRKREDMVRLEQRHRMNILILGTGNMHPHESQIEVEHRRVVEEQVRRGRQASLPKVSHADVEVDTAHEEGRRQPRRRRSEEADGVKADAAETPPTSDAAARPDETADQDAHRPRRRRSSRGRRGGGRSRETAAASSEAATAPSAVEASPAKEGAGSADAPSTAAVPSSGEVAIDSLKTTRRRRASRGRRTSLRASKTGNNAAPATSAPPAVVDAADMATTSPALDAADSPDTEEKTSQRSRRRRSTRPRRTSSRTTKARAVASTDDPTAAPTSAAAPTPMAQGDAEAARPLRRRRTVSRSVAVEDAGEQVRDTPSAGLPSSDGGARSPDDVPASPGGSSGEAGETDKAGAAGSRVS